MDKSTLSKTLSSGLHLAIIPDGNGRWALEHGRPRAAGYRAGRDAVRRVVEAAPGLGVATLTIYAFSSDNWQRPAREVATMMQLFEEYLRDETEQWVAEGVRVNVIGRRDRLSPGLRAAIETAERATAAGRGLHLRLAIDYSSRDAILRAACRLYTATEVSREAFAKLLTASFPDGTPVPNADLVIRTGGEQRLSDFLLWESAYAELLFTPRLWPDFAAADLAAAVREFRARERRFGRLPEAIAG